MALILLPTLAVAFAAFCVWLTVRIVNRGERWAKWTLAGVVLVPAVYIGSVGPADWLVFHGPFVGTAFHVCDSIYRPLEFLAEQSEAAHEALWWYRSRFVSESYLEELILSDSCR